MFVLVVVFIPACSPTFSKVCATGGEYGEVSCATLVTECGLSGPRPSMRLEPEPAEGLVGDVAGPPCPTDDAPPGNVVVVGGGGTVFARNERYCCWGDVGGGGLAGFVFVFVAIAVAGAAGSGWLGGSSLGETGALADPDPYDLTDCVSCTGDVTNSFPSTDRRSSPVD